MNLIPDLIIAKPELTIVGSTLLLLLYGAFMGNKSTATISWLSVLTMSIAAVLVIIGPVERVTAFNNLFVVEEFSNYAKLLILLAAAFTLILAMPYNKRENILQFEFPILILFSVLGMMMMVSANDLISLYLGIELQSLSLYVLATIRRDSVKSAEAGLKYFVLGALSSGILLYGMSMVYGFSGSTSFDKLSIVFDNYGHNDPIIGVTVGLVFIIAGLAFKISAVPFHMWTPDVYEGAPTPITAFFAIAPKVAAMILIIRILIQPFGEFFDQWQQIVWFISAASMTLGAFAAINQNNIKRLMAYSSIGHMGFIKQGRMIEDIDQLAGLSRTNPIMAVSVTIFMFSMAGIPPLAGFFGKYFIFKAAIEADLYTLAVLGVLASVVSSYYYLRIVKLMYFDNPLDSFDSPIGKEISRVTIGMSVAVVFFIFIIWPILNTTAIAAATLFAI